MRAFCKKVNPARRLMVQEIIGMYGSASFYKSVLNNTYYAILDNYSVPVNNVSEIVLRDDKTKTPLWKQQMNISMGKPMIQDSPAKIVPVKQISYENACSKLFTVLRVGV